VNEATFKLYNGIEAFIAPVFIDRDKSPPLLIAIASGDGGKICGILTLD
jgi:hypothetical protein